MITAMIDSSSSSNSVTTTSMKERMMDDIEGTKSATQPSKDSALVFRRGLHREAMTAVPDACEQAGAPDGTAAKKHTATYLQSVDVKCGVFQRVHQHMYIQQYNTQKAVPSLSGGECGHLL